MWVNSKHRVRSKWKCESYESCVCIVGFWACGNLKKERSVRDGVSICRSSERGVSRSGSIYSMPQQQRVFITKHGREHNRKRLRFPNCRDRNLDQMLLCLTRFFFPSAIATITWLFCYSVLFVWHSVGMYYGNEVTRISLGNVRPQSSQLAEPQPKEWN